MSNDFYNASGSPATGSPGSSATMRAEFGAIKDAFDKLPSMAGNANRLLIVNSSATALVASQQALPQGLLVGTNDVQTLTNKTIDSISNHVGADHIHYKVKATQNLNKGDVVKVVGYNSGLDAMEVARVSSATDIAVGVVYSNIANGAVGPIINTGILEGIDTSAFPIGTILYPNTSGGFTSTKPTTGDYQAIAFVVRQNSNNGTILIEASEPSPVITSAMKTFLATPSSANLAAAVADETGTGALVFANSPVLVTPNLGTPSAINLSNATNLPLASVTGLGAGVATFLATPSSANLAAAVTNETGTGALVFAGSPALTGTPTAPTAVAGTNTTQIATTAHVFAERTNTATLTNKTLTSPVISSIVNTGTLTLPTSTDTLVGRATTDTLTNKTISGANNTISNIGNASLVNSSITIGSNTISLGGNTATLSGLTSVSATTFTGALTGNASSATILQTTRTIWGQNFNGSANVTGNLTDVGTIAFGTQTNKATLTYATNTARTLTVPALGGNRTFAFIDEAQTFSANQIFSGNVTINGNTTLGDANTDTVTVTGRFNTDLVPSTDNARDLGTSALRWKQIFAATFTESGFGVVSQTDIGTAPNEIPLNQYLGNLAYQDAANIAGPVGLNNNLNFIGTANRIAGDFSNATPSNRVSFQTSTANGITILPVLPNGSETTSIVRAYNNSNPNNASYAELRAGPSLIELIANREGTGALLPIAFGVNNAERMRIDTAGFVLIGRNNSTDVGSNANTTAGVAIEPSGYAHLARANSATKLILQDTSNRSGTYATFISGSAITGSIDTNGTTTTYATSSDARMKENIEPAGSSGDVIDAIEIVQYDWKISGAHDPFGVIAQDLASVAPYAVKVGDHNAEVTSPWGVDYSKLVPLLVKEVQSLRARVAALEAQ
jgi:hypothetical protein